MSPSWIKLHRQLRRNELWKERPFSSGQAWVDLLLRVTPRPMMKDVPLQPGQMLTSSKKLAHDWGWSKSRVQRFLRELEADDQIRLDYVPDARLTLITAVNWEPFQEPKETATVGRSSPTPSKPAPVLRTDPKDVELKRQIQEVFDRYCALLERTSAYRLTPTRKSHIKRRLQQDKFSVEDLILAFETLAASDWHRGANPSDKRYDHIEQVVGTTERCERWVLAAREKPVDPADNGRPQVKTWPEGHTCHGREPGEQWTDEEGILNALDVNSRWFRKSSQDKWEQVAATPG